MARALTVTVVLLVALCLVTLSSAARVHSDALFASSVSLPAGARNLLPTHLADLVQRRSLLASSGSYGYGGYGYGYGYGR